MGILKATQENTSYSNLLRDSKIYFKRSFFKYVNFCVDQNLVSRKVLNRNRNGKVCKSEYALTFKGRTLMELLDNVGVPHEKTN